MNKSKQETLNKIILLAVLVGIISAIYYISNNTGFKSFRGEKTTTIERQKENLSQEEKILDCAKKIVQDEELLAKGENEQDNCLFMGCGDFFR